MTGNASWAKPQKLNNEGAFITDAGTLCNRLPGF